MNQPQNSYKSITGLFVLFVFTAQVVHAQVKPNTQTKTPNATGTVVTPYNPNPTGYTSGILFNYIRTWQPQVATTDENYVTSTSRTVDEVNAASQYFDGLGRPLQTVNWQVSPGKQDIVAPVVYDAFGREQYKFLPYTSPTASASGKQGEFKTNPFTEQSTFFTTTYKTEQPAFNNEKYFYSHTLFESSPLNRVTETFAPGNSWSGSEGGTAEKSINIQYLVNTTADAVRIWKIDFNTTIADNTNIPYSNGTDVYGAGQLYKTVSIDEAGNAVVEYKDNDGHVVLKKVQIGTIAADFSGYTGFLCTYYVYDDVGQLRTVIQPKAVASMSSAGTWVLSQAKVNELCFRYEYDERQRMIAKKVPGAGWVYMVYDNRDRLVFTQDANMRSKSPQQWAYILYDDLNRPVQAGIVTYTSNWSALQTAVDNLSTTAPATPNTNSGTYVTVNPADLYINSREIGRTDYKATNSIVFEDGFESEADASFTAQIITETATTFSATVNVNASPTSISGTTFYPLTYSYYDYYSGYNFDAGKGYSSANNSKLDGGGNKTETLEAIPSQNSIQTKGMITGTRVRVIEDPNNLSPGKWLETVNYYDDKGRLVQVQSDNYKGGEDELTTRYNFTGKAVCVYLVHNNASGNITNLAVKTNMDYDHAGRLLKVTKQLNDNTSTKRTIIQNQYDALGQLKNKKLGQKSSVDTNPLETDDYAYNIRGWLKGINWDYSGASNTKPQAAADKWFAMDLSYDWGYNNGASATGQYNGNIGGIRWMGDGDGEERSYGFAYDKANRLMKGDFTRNLSSIWTQDNVINFDMKMGDGTSSTTAYDENGNILKMQQNGMKLTSTGPGSALIDNLTYTYFNGGNKLQKVDDAITADNKLGDFTDQNTGDDYGYDVNGNLLSDKNKRMNGTTGEDLAATAGAIQYNHLNLPWKITVKDDAGNTKGYITYIYDAVGNKLEKRTQELASASNGNTDKITQTAYLGVFVYENNKLQFLGHEEGRIRPIVPSADNGNQSFAYDYFLKDHLGNIRTVLTDEQKTGIYQAGMEDANRSFEVALFGDQINSTAQAKPPGFDANGANAKVSKVNGTTAAARVGPGVILKVMAGDKFKATTYAWYQPTGMDNTVDGTLQNIVLNILSQLTPAVAMAAKGTPAAQVVDANLQPGIQQLINTQAPISGAPKGYLNWILLDEQQLKPVTGNQGFVAVPQITGTTQKQLLQANSGNDITITKNGYLYVYVSNESKGNVYFDDIRIEHKRGALLEETHYYPFGLNMSGINSKALNFGDSNNKYKYNGIENNSDFDLNIYDAFYRNLDPQIGRFLQIDPVTTHNESPYASMGNNPILNKDWLGNYFTWGDNTVKDTYDKLRNQNCNLLQGYMNELSNLNLNSKDEKVQKQIKQLTSLINMHANLNSQWDEMENSAVEFNVSSDMPSDPKALGDTHYNNADDKQRVDIRLGSSNKDISVMAHEFRHGYGYLKGEMLGGTGKDYLYDMTDEVVGFNTGYLFKGRGTANLVANGYFDVQQFKDTQLKNYQYLSGLEVSLTINTPAAVFMNYYNSESNRISRAMANPKNNINTVKDAIDLLNQYNPGEYRYCD